MSRILILSSWVAHGHVGLSAAVPVLQGLGHSVTQLPTVQLSNHPGWPHVAGRQVPPPEIDAMIGALEANGWLGQCDTLLTGYLPSPGHVTIAADLVARLRAAGADPRVVVDPVLGDAPKGLYVDAGAAAALRDGLVPLADVLTPNAFELGWLSGTACGTLENVRATAETLRGRTRGAEILVTSPPLAPGATGILALTAAGAEVLRAPLQDAGRVPNGPGDVFSALIAGGVPPGAALGQLGALVAASLGAPHLRIAEAASSWRAAPPVAAEPIDRAPPGALR
ncbi:pyridoxal kinase [Roseibacterium sp. SDUM158017]|uniref:pyridoxal kinase n=1 Tax=Roseicyclus salinarum TaxID=3036773 RepID=UPI002414F79B|nr:pyridoxal kinase [Roseibacterium sp. SDUM158017]MDG4649687.1 pyridoxal kinase [Roseibacterium sp. SDUM158017]